MFLLAASLAGCATTVVDTQVASLEPVPGRLKSLGKPARCDRDPITTVKGGEARADVTIIDTSRDCWRQAYQNERSQKSALIGAVIARERAMKTVEAVQ